MHLQPKLKQYATTRCAVAESLNERGLCLPIHYQLTDSQIAEVIDAIRAFFSA
jgi:dTDP-4-amino-4,6-dideoxygalactose transaminase